MSKTPITPITAMREHSRSRGATRTIGFVLASYADKYGHGVYVGLDRLCKEAKVARKTAVDGRRWFIDNGEAEWMERPDGKPLMQGRTQKLSFAPLLDRARGSVDEPLGRGSTSEPLAKRGSSDELGGVHSGAPGVHSATPRGSVSEPELGSKEEETNIELGDARAGARDGASQQGHDSNGNGTQSPDDIRTELGEVEELLEGRPQSRLLRERRDELREIVSGLPDEVKA